VGKGLWGEADGTPPASLAGIQLLSAGGETRTPQMRLAIVELYCAHGNSGEALFRAHGEHFAGAGGSNVRGAARRGAPVGTECLKTVLAWGESERRGRQTRAAMLGISRGSRPGRATRAHSWAQETRRGAHARRDKHAIKFGQQRRRDPNSHQTLRFMRRGQREDWFSSGSQTRRSE
jgi:hypothetical protein